MIYNDFRKEIKLMTCTIFWHKLNPKAVLPTKRDEDAGFDIYTIEDQVVIGPHEKHLFSTGLQYSITDGYYLLGFDRGSTGSKGLHLHCGVCDQGYRGEVFICINNDNNYPVHINSTDTPGYHYINDQIDYFVYPTTKAIAQLIPMRMPDVDNCEVSDDVWELMKLNSERGEGKLGASGK